MTSSAPRLEIIALEGIPDVVKGDDLAAIVIDGLERNGLSLARDDILVVAQKIVSKAEGRMVDLKTVKISHRARHMSKAIDKDARLLELILGESEAVMRTRRGLIIVRHKLGYVLANAGIDASNVEKGRDETVLLLPADPDGSAAALRTEIEARTGIRIGVVINDSLGRAWRAGTTGTALGAAGLTALADLRGKPDMFGRPMEVSEIGLADEVAAAASLMMGQTDERRPVVLIRGLPHAIGAGTAADLVRPRDLDLFD